MTPTDPVVTPTDPVVTPTNPVVTPTNPVVTPTQDPCWSAVPDSDTVCQGIVFAQTVTYHCGDPYDMDNQYIQYVAGTKAPIWSDWLPSTETIACGTSFTQIRIDTGGTCVTQYQSATGTKDCGPN